MIILLQPMASASEQPTDHFILSQDGQKEPAFHMVVIGDSIAWGNGLHKENKSYYLVADWLQKQLDRPVDVTVYAHSGATISGSGESCTPIDPNLNSGCPTLMDQANGIQNADDIDLILVSGGINDVGVFNILNPTSVSDIVTERSKEIYGSMKDLLSTLSEKGDAKIIVTDYYPIVTYSTEEKYFSMLNDLFDLRIQSVNNFVVEEARLNLISNSNTFQGLSHISLKNAVNDSNNGGDRIALASIYFQDSNSYGASDTYLWKLVSLVPPKTDDEFFENRTKLCDPIDITKLFDKDFKINENWLKQVNPEVIDNYVNYINAIGHPNQDGAKEYARAIKSVIESKGLNWLQNESAISLNASNTQESRQQVSPASNVESTKQPRISWIRKNQLYTGYTKTSSIQQTSDEGYIIASSYDFDDIRLAKIDANGDLTWDMTFKGPEEENIGNTDEKAFSVQQMGDGGYNLLGSTSDVNGIFAWLIKTDSQGNIIWDKTVEVQNTMIGGRQTNDERCIIATALPDKIVGLSLIDSDGNRLWDKTFEEATFDPGREVKMPVQQTKDGGYIFACNRGDNGTFLIKTDGQGNELWRKLFSPPGPSMNFAYSIQETSDGGYIVAGSEDVYGGIIRTDSLGNVVWNETYDMLEDSKLEWASIQSALQTSEGGFILAEKATEDGGFEKIGIIKTDSHGNKEWDKKFFLFSGFEYSTSLILQTNDGGYLVGGDTDFYGPWLVKIGGSDDTNGAKVNPDPRTDSHEQQEVNAVDETEVNQSGIEDEAATSKVPGFSGILAIAALIFIFIFPREKR